MCHRQLAQLRERLDEITAHTATLLAVDPHESWSAKYLLKETGLTTDDLNYPLLMDPSLTASAAYGVAGQMRIHTEWSNRPATFVIDKQGILRFAHVGTTFNDRPNANRIIETLQTIQE